MSLGITLYNSITLRSLINYLIFLILGVLPRYLLSGNHLVSLELLQQWIYILYRQRLMLSRLISRTLSLQNIYATLLIMIFKLRPFYFKILIGTF